MKIVIALGGNALLGPEQKGTFDEQAKNVRTACEQILKVVQEGHNVAITHGNGPQVGNLAIQQSSASDVPENPLDALDAMTQGEVGYLIQRELGNLLRWSGSRKSVVSVITQVLVDAGDPSFGNPTKPIGPFYSEAEANKVAKERGFVIRKVGRGNRPFRRVVPSPEPEEIVESEAITKMVDTGMLVIAGGGGGIPVIKNRDSRYEGIEAVIDKDLCASKLAQAIGADALLIITNVDGVMLDYGTPKQRALDTLTVLEARNFLAQGQFPDGSMGPKVKACMRFVERGGRFGVIAPLEKIVDALKGSAGTTIKR